MKTIEFYLEGVKYRVEFKRVQSWVFFRRDKFRSINTICYISIFHMGEFVLVSHCKVKKASCDNDNPEFAYRLTLSKAIKQNFNKRERTIIMNMNLAHTAAIMFDIDKIEC